MDKNYTSETPNTEKAAFQHAWWTPFGLFERIDSQQSETRRRITQNVIGTILAASIIAIISLIWSHWDTLAGGSKTIFNLLRSPVQLKLWILLLAIVGCLSFTWLIYRARNKPRNFKNGPDTNTAPYAIPPKTLNNDALGTNCEIITKRRIPGKGKTSTTLTVLVKNNGKLATCLLLVGADYHDESSRGHYLGTKNIGITLVPNASTSFGMDILEPLLYDYEHEQRAKRLWIKDISNTKHVITNSESNVRLYFVDETYG